MPRTKLLSQYARMMGIIVAIRDRYRRSLRSQENHFAPQDQSIITGGGQEQSTLMRDSLLRVHVTLLSNSRNKDSLQTPNKNEHLQSSSSESSIGGEQKKDDSSSDSDDQMAL